MNFVLASQSPRRIEILKQLGYDFEVVPSSVEEVFPELSEYREIPADLAAQKALDVSKVRSDDFVLGFDTVVFLNQVPLGKPRDNEEAGAFLKSFSGTRHEVISGVALYKGGELIERAFEVTQVDFRDVTEDEIFQYLNTGEHEDKAGAYGIQGKGATFVKSLEGCYYNVVGLPVFLTESIIKRHIGKN